MLPAATRAALQQLTWQSGSKLSKGIQLQASRIVAASVSKPKVVGCFARGYCSESDGGGFRICAYGFPHQTTDEEILEFLKLDRSDISRFLHPRRPDGEFKNKAFLTIRNEAKYKSALERDREYLGDRYVQVTEDHGPPDPESFVGRPAPSRRRRDEFYDQGRSSGSGSDFF